MMPQDATPAVGYAHGLCYGPEAPPRYFRLVVYPTVEGMRAAALAHDKHRGFKTPPGYFSDALGMFQPSVSRARYDRRTRKWVDTSSRFAGVMRLVQGNCTRTIVAHECIHAILQIARMESWRTEQGDASGRADYGDASDQREEHLAYLLSETIVAVDNLVTEMHERAGLVRLVD